MNDWIEIEYCRVLSLYWGEGEIMGGVFAIGLLILAAPVASAAQISAQNAQPGPESAAASADKGANEQVCRRVVPTGSNFSRRVCFTRAEWKQIHDRDQENAARALAKRSLGSPKDPFGN